MARPQKIILPKFYPRTCEECPLCGTRPKEDLQPADKWTHICVATDRILSGRGIKQPAARNRCGEKAYKKMFFSYLTDKVKEVSEYLISPTRMKKYGISQQKLLFEPKKEE